MMRVVAAAIALLAVAWPPDQPPPPIDAFIEAASLDDQQAKAALETLAVMWKNSYTSMIIDLARLMPAPGRAVRDVVAAVDPWPAQEDERGAREAAPAPLETARPLDRRTQARRRLMAFLERQTGQSFGQDLSRWREWMWQLPADPHPEYARFKGLIYGRIDPRMRGFFPPGVSTSIRLDEIDWGGVAVNGIPPLRYPAVIPASSARYLKDSNVVFGIVVNGEARAYPKRILGWHEMAIDRPGGVELTVVFCTLCGTVIPFESGAGGRLFHFGTSGLVYRSNKLMFDEETRSLWSTFEGIPVVGSLVGSGVALRSRPVVTTTWGEWRAEHPDTTVLSIETGFKRDYAEGAAYRDYFATDRLMFQVSKKDARLRNKAEVLVMRVPQPVAIDVEVLRKHPVYMFALAGQQFVVVTTAQGANRVYRTDAAFPEAQRSSRSGAANRVVDGRLQDIHGRIWHITETGLTLEGQREEQAPRVSAQRAFWFGWFAQFPDTVLVK